MLTIVWPLPMPFNAYSKKDNMALLSLYTMLKGTYHGDFDQHCTCNWVQIVL